MSYRVVRLALVAAVLVACKDGGGSGPVFETFSVSMTGAKERPTPVVTTGSGATLTVSLNGDTVRYAVSAVNLSSAVTAVHIHGPADEANAASPIRTLTLGGTGNVVAIGSFTAPDPGVPAAITFDSIVSLLRNQRAYINVHTTTNTGGEIRGQIVPD
jgi:hypothetical protein